MSKVRVYSVEKAERNRIIRELFEIIANLKNKEEVFGFMLGLFSPSESLMIGRRIQIAKLLLDDFGYDYIEKKLKVSHQTINKIEHWLNDNEERGKILLKNIENNEKKRKMNNRYKGEYSLLDRYAHHRFLKDLLQ